MFSTDFAARIPFYSRRFNNGSRRPIFPAQATAGKRKKSPKIRKH